MDEISYTKRRDDENVLKRILLRKIELQIIWYFGWVIFCLFINWPVVYTEVGISWNGVALKNEMFFGASIILNYFQCNFQALLVNGFLIKRVRTFTPTPVAGHGEEKKRKKTYTWN